MPSFSLRHLLLTGVAFAALAGHAVAQTDAAAGAMAIPEVDVQATAWRSWEHTPGYVAPVTTTGSKTDTPLIEAPQSVGVVTRDQIDDQAALSVSQALRYTAGVLPEVRPSARYDSVFVRGFGGQGTSAAFVNFLDGLRQGRGVFFGVPNTDPWLLERIEVLRGPASVLYGQTGAGGLVNLVSRRPSAESSNEVRLEAGSYKLLQAAFDSTGRLTNDGKFLYRLTGIGRISDTQYDFVGEQRVAIAPAVTWRPNDNTTLTVLSSYQRDPEGGFYNFVPAVGTVIASPFGRIPRNFFGGDPDYNKFDRTQASIGYQLEHRLNDTWTVRQNFRYSHIDAEVNVLSVSALNGRIGTRNQTYVSDHANAFALDNQAQATFSTGMVRHTALFGIDWQRTSARAVQALGTNVPTLDVFAPTYYIAPGRVTTNATRTNQENDQIGFYAQDQIAIDRLRLNFGLRYDRATQGTDTRTLATDAVVHRAQFDDAVTWRAGALYLFDSGIAPYFSYSTSFLPNSGTGAPQRGSPTFDATTGEQYEVGVKYQPPGMTSFVQAAAFQITQDNVLTRDPVFTTFNAALGTVRSRGIEVDARATINENIDLIGAYSYTDAIIKSSNTPGETGSRVPQVPLHAASGWANYTFREGPLRGLQLGGGVRYLSSTYGNTTNTFKVDDVALFDAAIRYDVGARFESFKGLELAVNAQNIADKDFIASCSSITACYYGTGRLVLGSVRVRW
ncbi:TonB-dependent siderophore receptor [Roseomonas populi]|uniref:TonB-dependent siderophore receptor n=1 Tax=Roseomonas populi TaxID=3121582 RepID=A0ABT1X746_9PROT|nr:TonB-dependent siderophore receptor [Roseomonas pecuniae]MCR0983223.1 TonB-dependent siderophore receptor [Roseomonas pecuniae]